MNCIHAVGQNDKDVKSLLKLFTSSFKSKVGISLKNIYVLIITSLDLQYGTKMRTSKANLTQTWLQFILLSVTAAHVNLAWLNSPCKSRHWAIRCFYHPPSLRAVMTWSGSALALNWSMTPLFVSLLCRCTSSASPHGRHRSSQWSTSSE